ncbi:hypothetical protein M3661_01670 [Paenibacillus sp. MER 180]|uniref:hypothetical protein n=1 Tax=Paenibacillus sp. MER 180 TaxID=2939570 RepID=UPI00203CDF69|nr:hypothetical protein [Paenibacillus sp. MER 180]MCM3288842.1 hypothetical protein [Paenibacillus sp. MER 180]
MTLDSLKSLEKDVGALIKSILVDLKMEKKCNEGEFDILLGKLNEYKFLLRKHEVISKSFAGELFYLFSTMVLEAKYTNYEPQLMKKIFDLRSVLLSLYNEEIFG